VRPVERYRVFGRTSYPEPLEFQGTLTAADHDAAAHDALERHGRRWVELVLIPEHAIHWVLGPADRPEGSGEPHERGGRSPPRAPQSGAPVDPERAGDG
jgi:1,2-phenylacetyl-CoA epoxidase PaaB subunit